MSDAELARLKWLCRRGVKELDIVLEKWLASRYQSASAEEQKAFAQLLELEDPVLFDLIQGNGRGRSEVQARVIAQLSRQLSENDFGM